MYGTTQRHKTTRLQHSTLQLLHQSCCLLISLMFINKVSGRGLGCKFSLCQTFSAMAIFSVSDIVISATLIVNALALMSSKIPRINQVKSSGDTYDDEKTTHRTTPFMSSLSEEHVPLNRGRQSLDNDQNESESRVTENAFDYSGAPIMVRLQMLVFGIRKYSCVIVIWNVFYFTLMVFVFGS